MFSTLEVIKAWIDYDGRFEKRLDTLRRGREMEGAKVRKNNRVCGWLGGWEEEGGGRGGVGRGRGDGAVRKREEGVGGGARGVVGTSRQGEEG